MNPRIKLTIAAWLCFSAAVEAQRPELTFREGDGRVVIEVNGEAIAHYVYRDDAIPRPYFAHVKTPGGIQVTRHHPPQSGDRSDHATMHPGIWLAFGDLGGEDFWRNKASVRHVDFLQEPASERNMGSFIEKKQYTGSDGRIVCDEEFRFAVLAKPEAILFVVESIFSGTQPFSFGDQEEMGLGVRVATPVTEVAGGNLTDAEGRAGAKTIWGNAAAWCDYSGVIDGQRVGVTVMSHPTNFRETWWHARDYGLITANPFGRAAMKQGAASRIVVQPGETFRLRFAVYVHSGAEDDAIAKAYGDYAKLGQ
ncbi:hypothetical protein Enr13x_06600 [Stieleria neptunia]|uniref:Methane oxygenase PmoA n=1 Tax=Stieleria neptunia TaxID=2527979 RepID=A0A518HIZ1_9BACT|nr:PmoA family protein [Stieleria neptunia]QDV40824.1 hypothetical protein Enr13x_06600 [Stieleria neptunia]